MNLQGFGEGFLQKCAAYRVNPMLVKQALDPQTAQILGMALPALLGGGMGAMGAKAMGYSPWAGGLAGAGLGGLGGYAGGAGDYLQGLELPEWLGGAAARPAGSYTAPGPNEGPPSDLEPRGGSSEDLDDVMNPDTPPREAAPKASPKAPSSKATPKANKTVSPSDSGVNEGNLARMRGERANDEMRNKMKK